MIDTHTIPNFDTRFLVAIKGGSSPENYILMESWRRTEGLFPNSKAKWNPLHTSYYIDGFTESLDYNTSGPVRNYKYEFAGLAATILTVTIHETDGTMRYGGIISDLQKGAKTADQIVNDRMSQFAKWGTDVQLLLEVISDVRAGR